MMTNGHFKTDFKKFLNSRKTSHGKKAKSTVYIILLICVYHVQFDFRYTR